MAASSNTMRQAILTVLAICIFISLIRYQVTPRSSHAADPYPQLARQISAKELLARPISHDVEFMPKLLHQSWSDYDLPPKFKGWSGTCREKNSDWEWVLWTDEDNLALVEQYFPWFVETFKALPGPISRADASRSMYMYIYGGVYADLDVECLRPYDELFALYNVTTVPYSSHRMGGANTALSGRKAFFGRMGADPGHHESIPNAWMAATPGHPFHLLPLESVQQSYKDGSAAGKGTEVLTGPGALMDCIINYRKQYEEGKLLEEHWKDHATEKLFKPQRGKKHSVEVLPFWFIFPYSWARDGEMYRDLCWVTEPRFNATRCKLVLGTEYWPSYTITYWSHSWAAEGHDENKMKSLVDD